MRRPASTCSAWTFATGMLVVLSQIAGDSRAACDPPDLTARELIALTGFSGGLIVHLDCGSGERTAELGSLDGFTVQGLDQDAERVARARERIAATGRYGPVSADRWDGQYLPYGDNLVNVVVMEHPDVAPWDQVRRILVPGGVALVREAGEWTRRVKPRPQDIDDWTHYLHGPGNNAVARDMVVGPPRHFQWISGPRFARSHEFNSSQGALVSSDGRIYSIQDEGPIGIGDPRFPSRWTLLARDAFNGRLLWRQSLPEWGWQQWHSPQRWETPRERYRMLRYLPPVLPRRLVAAEGKLFVTLGYHAPLSVLDGASGEVLRVLEGTEPTDEVLYAGEGLLVLSIREPEPDVGDLMDAAPARGRIAVFDVQEGRPLWQSEPETLAPATLAAQNGRVFYSTYDQLVSRDLTRGNVLWRTEQAPSLRSHRNTAGTLVAYDSLVFYTPEEKRHDYAHPAAGRLHAFCAETGQLLWRTEQTQYGPGITNQPDIFVAQGLVWGADHRGRPQVDRGTDVVRHGLDPQTGQVVQTIRADKLKSPGHHYRCYRSKATERYLLLPKRGVEFFDLLGENFQRHDWLRAPCMYGVMPANGMLYVPSHQCVCYPGVLLDHFNALVAHIDPSAGPPEPATRARRERGPAWTEAANGRGVEAAGDDSPCPADWPTYRADARRSGSVTTELGRQPLEPRWEFQAARGLTPAVVAQGTVLVAESDAHRVHALCADSGQLRWSFTAGGRIDSPPTVHQQQLLFGSADGWVYALRLDDGELAWRFLAAPRERRIAVYGQFESAWPVSGSVLVQPDPSSETPRHVAYVLAGRSTLVDGGLWLYGLDPQTGELLHQTRLEGPTPDPHQDVGTTHAMEGAKADVLVSDGSDLYFYQERFAPDLTRQTVESPPRGQGVRSYAPAPQRAASGRRLIATSGLLDDTYAEGSFWTYSDRWPGWDRLIGNVPGFGQLLVFDDHTTYGVNVFTERIAIRRGFTPGRHGYRLFAREHQQDSDSWSQRLPIRIRAMVLAGQSLVIAGPPDRVPAEDPLAAFEGRCGAELVAFSIGDGQRRWDIPLEVPPVFDGLIAAQGRLYLTTTDSRLTCYAPSKSQPEQPGSESQGG